jgi:AraC family cel operon transcriptional repressor
VYASDLEPQWLRELRRELEKPEHFVVGYPRLLTLAMRSPEHVARNFKRYCGKSPVEYINERRLNYAANLLAHSDASIADIALEMGFANLSHFYRLFRRAFAQSPTACRRLHQVRFS